MLLETKLSSKIKHFKLFSLSVPSSSFVGRLECLGFFKVFEKAFYDILDGMLMKCGLDGDTVG